MSIDDKRGPKATRAAGAYIFFAALYFVQSVGDPTSGLVAQPVRSLLKSWGESPAALGALMALIAVPWTIKPVFGLLSDFVPLFGSRRRNYLLLANGGAALSLLLLAFVPIAPGSLWLLFALLLPTTMAIALGDVIVDALMVEKGQPLGLTGRFQSIQWAAANAALLLTGVLGGYVAEERLQSVAFALCGVLWVFAFAVAWRYAGDHEDAHLDAASLSETGAALFGVLHDKLFLAVCALLTLWSFNPVWGSVLYVHMTEDLGFSEQDFGNVTSAFFLGSLIGSVGYGIYCRSVRLSTLLYLSILAAIVSNAVYWQLDSLTSAYVVSDHRRRGLHDRHTHSIGLDRAHHTGEGRGDGVRNRHGAHQFCGVGVGSVRRMGVRGRENIIRARDGIQPRGRDERRRGRELLAIGPCTSSRRSSMVGLAPMQKTMRQAERRCNVPSRWPADGDVDTGPQWSDTRTSDRLRAARPDARSDS